jgi:hypothetical protein
MGRCLLPANAIMALEAMTKKTLRARLYKHTCRGGR